MKYIQFFVIVPTKIATPPEDTNVKRGSMAELMCQAQCDQSFRDELKIVWKKNGEAIDSNNTEYSR